MYEELRYKKNPLSQVVIKADFLAPLIDLDAGIPPKLATLLASKFPIEDPGGELLDYQFAANREGAEASVLGKSHVYKYFGREREKDLSFSNKFLTIVQRKYDTYEAFAEDFIDAYKAVQQFFPDVQTSRLGLRYINLLEIDEATKPLKWEEFVNPDLIATAQFFQHDAYVGKVARLFHVAELKYEDFGVRFQFGEPNPDFPAVMKRAQFVLDMDAYVQSAHRPEDSFTYMERAHSKIQEIFEGSITEQLRGWMDA